MAMEKIEKKTLEDLLIKAIEKHLCALLKSAFMHVELCLRSNAIPIKREYSRESIEPLPIMTHAQHRCFRFIAQRPSHPPQMKYRPSVWVYCVREIVGKDCQ